MGKMAIILHNMYFSYFATLRKVMTLMTLDQDEALNFMIFTSIVIEWTITTVGKLF